jgi:hypothetical protein
LLRPGPGRAPVQRLAIEYINGGFFVHAMLILIESGRHGRGTHVDPKPLSTSATAPIDSQKGELDLASQDVLIEVLRA